MKSVIIKILNFLKKIQLKKNSYQKTHKNFQENELRSKELTDNGKLLQLDKKPEKGSENNKLNLNEEMKYLFPSSEVDFKNFATDTQNYSTIIHHHENMVTTVKSLLKNESIDSTIHFLETIKSFYKKFPEFYLKLLSLDKLLMNELNNKISKDTDTILSFSIWGASYAEKFCLLALNSIKKDLIETYQKHKVQMILFVNQSAKDILKKDSNFIELDKLDIVKVIIIPNDIFQSDYYLERIAFTRYYVFGFIQNICWRFSAINEINLSLLTPDNYYSQNFVKNLIVKINDNKDLLAIFSSSSVKVQINEEHDIKEYLLSIRGMNLNELFNFYKKNIHHSQYDYFISQGKKIENNSSHYILNSDKALLIYSLHSHPYILSKKYLKKYKNYFTFLPIDESFPFQNSEDKNFFEKMVDLEDGLAIDFCSFEDTGKNMVSYSEDNMFHHFSKYKNNELNIWFLKNPVKLNHNESSDLTFNYINENKKSLKTNSPDSNNTLLKNFQQLIEKI